MAAGSTPAMRKLRSSSLAQEAYASIHEMMLEGGRYRPGEKISVEEISRELGVSRSPVWDAIARLSAEGLVEVVPRQGVYFLSLDADHVRELFTARAVLEGTAAREAALQISGDDLAILISLVAGQKPGAGRRNGLTYSWLSLDFSRELLRLSRNRTIARILEPVYAQLQALFGRSRIGDVATGEALKAYKDILGALRLRDGGLAEHAVHSHIEQIATAVIDMVNEATSPPLRATARRVVGERQPVEAATVPR